MFMASRFLFWLLLLMPCFYLAQPTRVLGLAKGYEGRKLIIVALQDELSAKRQMLAQCDVADDGRFDVTFQLPATARVYVHIQRVEAPLYAQPGKTYSVVFPEVSKTDFKRFDNTEVDLIFENLPAEDVNLVIRKFNADFAAFISEHFYDFATDEYRGSPEYLRYAGNRKDKVDLYSRKSEVDTLQRNLEKGFNRWVKHFEDSVLTSAHNSSDSSFTAAYQRFSMAELHLLSGMNRKQFYELYFMSEKPLLQNPAFAGCFKLFTRNILTGQSAAVQADILRAVNIDRDLNRLSQSLSAECGLQSEQLRRLAALNALKDVYNNKSFDKASIDILLGKVTTSDTLVDKVAAALLYELKRCKSGWPIRDFVFTDETQDKWNLENADGLPVYLLFFASWSPASLKEILVIERWQEKYRGRIQFVAVCMDDDYRSYRKYVEENLKLPVKLVYGNAVPLVHEKFRIKAIPHQVMLDSAGVVVADVCPLPSDPFFESFVNRILVAVPANGQGPKTWRDN
jgi:thiol-disulfide isomerase/thioredoxin